jgi:Sigma-70, region 4
MAERKNLQEKIRANLFTPEDKLLSSIFGVTGEFPKISDSAEIERAKLLRHFLDNFTDQRDADILRKRFGIDTKPIKYLKEIGIVLGVTGARVRQLEGRALRKLRHPIHSRPLKFFLPFKENSNGKNIGLTCTWDFISNLKPEMDAIEFNERTKNNPKELESFILLHQLLQEDFQVMK